MLTEGMFLVDRYEILTKVGAGGMSDVYKAKDHILGRIVAIKVLKQEFSEDINFVTKFRTEAQSAAGLEHPNIVNIYDVGSESGMHFIVMEYIEGITLKTYVEKKGQLSFKEATSIAIQVARGIEAAHNKDITHRDIKPQNIMISTDGKVKVTDFGIAKAISSNTLGSDAMGSVHYASPEQARNGFIDGRSDLYSLGIVMYEMVTGRVPFDGETTVAVAIQHLQEEMVEPSVYAADLPISYEKIILKCTQKNPERRYQSVDELLADLRQALATPDEDFVVIAPVVVGDTRIINGEELDAIQTMAEDADLESETGFASAEGEEFEDDEYDEDEEFEDDEEDATGFLDPKTEKIVTIGGIALLVVIIGLVIFLAFSIGKNFFQYGPSTQKPSTQNTESSQNTEEIETGKKEQVQMINIVGMSKEEAEAELKKLGLELFVMRELVSELPDGTILEQNEKEGNMVFKGSKINVSIAGQGSTETLTAIPYVVGMTAAEAEAELKAKGFRVTKNYQYDDVVEEGLVISQTPEAGEEKPADDRVTIIISEGSQTKMIPQELIGKTEKDVIAALRELGFVANVVSQTSNDAYPAGIVFNIEGVGTKVAVGSTVVVYVSNDVIPETEIVPSNLVGKSKEYAEKKLNDLGFEVTVKTDATSKEPNGTVIKVEEAGAEKELGSTVTIVVSAKPETVKIPTNLIGMKKDDAVKELKALGFYVNVKTDENGLAEKDTVTLVEMAGVEVEVGSTVTIYVSQGPKETPSETPSETTSETPSESTSGSNE